jgi:hypothetical protein
MRLRVILLSLLVTASLHAQSSYQLVIPAAGDVPGANGTHFRSDLTILNLRTHAQQVQLLWLPRDVSGAALTPRTVTIDAGGQLSSERFVEEILGQTGLGSIIIRGINAQGQLDETARLYATSRIWTPQPGSTGTTSQTMPGTPLNSIAHEHVAFVGHRMSSQYRVNVGIANLLNDLEQTYRIHVHGSVLTLQPVIIELKVPPYSMKQVAVQWPEDPEMRIDVELVHTPGTPRGTLWIPYVSSVDNVTGDSWTTFGVEVEE